jgi:uncharacterized membrane protein
MEKNNQPKIFQPKTEWIFWILLLLPFLYIPFIWGRLPDSIPTHWDFNGEPNDYSSKAVGTLLLPLINIGMYFLLLFIPRIDPRKRSYEYFSSSYRNIRLAISVFMCVMFFIIMQWTLGNRFFNAKVIIILVLGLMAFLGNYLRTIKSNFFVGIRTPWTLDNVEVWKKTHEVGGRLWFYASLLTMLVALFVTQKEIGPLLITYFVIIVVIPVLYSYVVYRRIKSQ